MNDIVRLSNAADQEEKLFMIVRLLQKLMIFIKSLLLRMFRSDGKMASKKPTTLIAEDDGKMASKKPTILLAEDDGPTRSAMANSIQDFGFNVEVAVNGDEAIKKINSNKYHFFGVISDYRMPKINGDEVARIAKNKGLRVILCSAESPKFLEHLDVDYYIVKRVRKNDLAIAFRELGWLSSDDCVSLGLDGVGQS